MDDDDFGLDLEEQPRKSRNARQGRRARQAQVTDPSPAEDVAGGDEEEAGLGNDVNASRPETGGPPKPTRRQRGWGENSARTRGDDMEDMNSMGIPGGPFSERLRPHDVTDEEEDPDIPVIPDLEDAQEDDLTTQIAVAPNVAVNRVATYRELDNDLLRHAAFVTLDNEIDLKVLTKCLSAEADVIEEDKPWDWDRLFTEVTSELLTEWEAAEPGEEQEAGT